MAHSHQLLAVLGLLVGLAACGDKKAEPAAAAEPTAKQAPKKPVAVAPVTEAAPEVVLTAQQGEVEIRKKDVWLKADVGEVLDLDDAIRTEGESSANLQVGDVSVTLEPRTEVTVREVSTEVADLRLERGLIAAKVQGGGKQRLRVQAAGSSAVAETGDGDFTVFNDGKGLVAIAPTAGEVKLTSTGGDAVLAAGQRGTVAGSEAPKVDKVPRKVLLSVKWPEDEFAKPQTVVVRGKVDPGTRVEINGTQVIVDGEKFEATLRVKRGKTAVRVVAQDVTGRKTTSKGTIQVAPPLPGAEANPDGIWK